MAPVTVGHAAGVIEIGTRNADSTLSNCGAALQGQIKPNSQNPGTSGCSGESERACPGQGPRRFSVSFSRRPANPRHRDRGDSLSPAKGSTQLQQSHRGSWNLRGGLFVTRSGANNEV